MKFARVICHPGSVPGGLQQPGGRYRGGRFWPKGQTFAELTKDLIERLRADPCFVVDEIDEADFEAQRVKPVESDSEKLERLQRENAESRRSYIEMDGYIESLRGQNEQLRAAQAQLQGRHDAMVGRLDAMEKELSKAKKAAKKEPISAEPPTELTLTPEVEVK